MAEIESREDGITVTMKRQEAAALAAVTETALALAESPRSLFGATFDAIDLPAARRGLDQLRGALR